MDLRGSSPAADPGRYAEARLGRHTAVSNAMSDYQPERIETKWQAWWEQNHTFRTTDDFSKPKYYALDMFPYPSGA